MITLPRKSTLKTPRLLAGLALLVLIIASIAGPILAQSVTRSYSADETIGLGTLVAGTDDPDKVKVADKDSAKELKGVAVRRSDSPVTLSTEGQQVFVASNGSFEALVSDENGAVKSGDYITVSSNPGIGMKAGDNHEIALGKAVGNFDGKSNVVGSSTTEGGDRYNYGRVVVDIAVGTNPIYKTPEPSQLPAILQRIGGTVADREVSPARVYAAAALFLAILVIAGAMLYSGVRSSLVSIGRNPLSKKVIYGGLLQVSIISLAVFILGVFGVYLLLKL